ncbi:hypothetical protein PI126_g20305 [Phytophthora idaei]|nr:hypothetical protein PI126_g20305 [Phytophthora idaei]
MVGTWTTAPLVRRSDASAVTVKDDRLPASVYLCYEDVVRYNGFTESDKFEPNTLKVQALFYFSCNMLIVLKKGST